ncbi:hypothetical protein [Enterobacter hormaechei]|uniref:hypothetical protein n=1 Tax=Enterobacter hormaechei TaxID=158836 RepID=UPI0007B31F8E|nr:hypothetical protein [Enterobacter hormaechei]KZQ36752.1 hypothetical protein A3N44_17515 [Enterobacter hormaechei subsp. steigerwaltii]HCJ6307941.1 hypothetical protein [Enterobacter hormaechei subsp. xiangfangensis]
MSTITKQAVQAVADLKAGYTLGHADVAILNELARIALASLEAEPVAYMNRFTGRVFTLEEQPGADTDAQVYMPVYTTPPAPVAMKDHQIRELVNELRDIAVEYHGTQQLRERIARTIRAAMLQGVENAETPTTMQTAPALDSSPKFAESPSGNSPVIPDCWCRTCRPVVLNDMRFVVCPDCGNKRCPRANDHKNSCTGSNEPGQEGSAYPASPQEVKGE